MEAFLTKVFQITSFRNLNTRTPAKHEATRDGRGEANLRSQAKDGEQCLRAIPWRVGIQYAVVKVLLHRELQIINLHQILWA